MYIDPKNPWNAHRFDPCFKCGVAHDDLKIGPCSGPNQGGYDLYVRQCRAEKKDALSYDKWLRYSSM